MSKINEINIRIDKALITNVELALGEHGLEVIVTGNLISDIGKKVTSFRYLSNHWEDEEKLKIPFEMNGLARQIFELLTPSIYERINGEFKALPAGKKSKKDEPLNPEDIPF